MCATCDLVALISCSDSESWRRTSSRPRHWATVWPSSRRARAARLAREILSVLALGEIIGDVSELCPDVRQLLWVVITSLSLDQPLDCLSWASRPHPRATGRSASLLPVSFWKIYSYLLPSYAGSSIGFVPEVSKLTSPLLLEHRGAPLLLERTTVLGPRRTRLWL